jgi:hypothetical protein
MQFGGHANNVGMGHSTRPQHTTAALGSDQHHLRFDSYLCHIHCVRSSVFTISLGAGSLVIMEFNGGVASCTPMGWAYQCFQGANA